MDNNVNERVKNTVLEGLGQRKTMFVPMVCISSFMLVGYAALDKEAPEIITSSITMELSDLQANQSIDYDKIEAVDNRDDRDSIMIYSSYDYSSIDRPDTYTIYVTATDSFNNQSEPKEIKLNVVDSEAPELTVKESSEDGSFYSEDGNTISLLYNSSGDIRNYITATDNDKSSGVDGDVTNFIEQKNEIDTSAVGTQFVSVSVEDNSGNEVRKSYPITIFDNVKPVITLKQGQKATVNYGSEFNVNDYVDAIDELDGNLNDRVEVEVEGGGTIDTTIMGAIYNITVKVADNSGNTEEETITLTVADTEAPTITLSDNNFTVSLNDTVNVSDYVSVSDNHDQDIASKLVYSAATIDTSSTGDRSVTITATDEANNTGTATLTVTVVDPSTYNGSKVVSLAYTKIGCSYVYGGTGPNSFDCSGFTQWLYAQVGVSIPRTASTQYASGTSVSKSDLQPGDLVFFDTYGGPSHVGVYVGDGMMIHAGSSATGVNLTNINSSYWSSRYLGARRY